MLRKLCCLCAMLMFATPILSAAEPAEANVAAAPVFDIPKLDHIVIDGKADDWGERGFRVEALADSTGKVRPAADFNANFRLGWDDAGLLILINVADNVFLEDDNIKGLFQKDSIELLLGTERGSFERIHVAIAPGMTASHKEPRHYVYDYRNDPELKKVDVGMTLARTASEHGYAMELLIPWACLGVAPKTGRELAFQICFNDFDGAKRYQSMWYPAPIVYQLADTRRTQRIRLAAEPSPAVTAAAAGGYERFRRTRAGVVAPGDKAGKVVMVSEGDQVLSSALLEKDGDRSFANMTIYMPKFGKTIGTLTAFTINEGQHVKRSNEGTLLTTFELPDPNTPRREAFSEAVLLFKPFVFSGESFPACDFELSPVVEDLIGPYTLKTTFYDAEYNEVKSAKKPGRYGAVVEVKTEDGQVFKRFATLFRQQGQVKWRQTDVKFSVEFPKELGIDPDVMKEQAGNVSDYLKERFADDLSRSSRSAIFLAGLFETKPGASSVKRNSFVENDLRWWTGLKKKTGEVHSNYLLFTPQDYEKDTQKQWPLILFMHGSGERGEDLEKIKAHGPPKFLQTRKDFPFIVVSPQCPLNQWWSATDMGALLDEVSAKYRVDKDRIYVTGLSMGGYGTWAMALEYPDRFAAIAPMCGGSDPADAERIKDLPIWVFHGAKDQAVPIKRSEEMVEALKKVGSTVKFTVYPDADHDCWTRSYANEELYQWFMQFKRGQK